MLCSMYDFITTLERFSFNEENLIDDLLAAVTKGNKYATHKAWNVLDSLMQQRFVTHSGASKHKQSISLFTFTHMQLYPNV